MNKINLILGVLALIGVALVVVGYVLMDELDWMIIDIYFITVFILVAARLFTLRKTTITVEK